MKVGEVEEQRVYLLICLSNWHGDLFLGKVTEYNFGYRAVQ